jgi:BirA family transcriptional regulator, biotin operon repressor / biotin---[acetyl-CoA-carboxylase] ligase
MNQQNSRFIDDYHLLNYDVLDSTNEEAKRLALAGGQHGAVIWSLMQTEGRGRGDNSWQSIAGNLHFSLLLRPNILMQNLPQLSFVTSLALFRSIRTMTEVDLAIKWPNDLLLDGKKLAGILLETVTTEQQPWVIIGVGVNIEAHPNETKYPATSLKQCGLEIISAKIVLSRFLNMFESLYDEWCEHGFQHIRQQWLAHAAFLHEIISLQVGDKTLQGEFTSIDECGHIMLRTKSGLEILPAGEVCNIRPQRGAD